MNAPPKWPDVAFTVHDPNRNGGPWRGRVMIGKTSTDGRLASAASEFNPSMAFSDSNAEARVRLALADLIEGDGR